MSRSTIEHRLLSNRYRIEDFLGHGGMGQVYRGTDLVLNRTVAIKILADHLARDPQSLRRFRREAQAAAGLSHPGIVAVFDTGADGDVQYIVMECVDGRTLADVLRDPGALGSQRAVATGVAIAAALAHAHRKGIVHRDIKPGNVMITSSGAVKVMDFGIARAVTSDTLTQSAILGTAAYFAPEQARGEPVDARSDLYALGVVLYEMLTGRAPFAADSPVALAYQHVREEPIPPSRLNPAIGPGLEAVVLRAMVKDRDDRYQTAEEMAFDLERAPAGTDVLDAPFPPATSAAAATQVVSPPETAVLPPIGAPYPAVPATRTSRRRFRWAPWVVGWAALLVVVLIATLLATGLSRHPTGVRGPASSTSPSQPKASGAGRLTTSPSPARVAPSSVQDALTQLGLILGQGVSSGDVSRHAADGIGKDIQHALNEYQRGDLEKSLGTLDQLQERTGALQSNGEITPEVADRIHLGISDLQTTMQASPPPSSDEGGGNGRGGRD